MTDSLHDKCFPNEDQGYRKARNDLLLAERDLRAKLEEVASARQQLPLGGAIKEDYVFARQLDGTPGSVSLSDLFREGRRSLLVYSFMYGPDAQDPCPMCNVFVDGGDGIRHCWASELFFVPFEGRHPRHVDLLWSLWNIFDLTPDGRGSNWFPQPDY